MDAKSVRSIVVVFLGSLLLFLAAVLCSEGNRKIFQTLCGGGGNRFHLISQKIDQHTAEQVWSRCWKETEGSTETGRDFVTYLQYAVISRHNSKLISSEFLRKRKLEKAIAGLSPQAQHGLQDCLRRNYFPFHTLSNEIVSMKWFNKCLEIMFGPPHVPRRLLKQRHLIGTPSPGSGATSPDNAPSPATRSPADAPGPAATSPSAYAPGPDVTSPTDSPGSLAPLTPPVDAPVPASKLGGDSPKKSSPGSLSPPTTSPSRPKKSNQPPPAKAKPPHPDAKSSKDDQTYIVIAAAGGGAVLFTLGALLILCRSEKKHKIDPQDGKRDENNLLSVGLSDLSGDSKSSDGVSKLSTAGQVSASGVTGGASGPGLTVLPLPPGRAPPPAPVTPPPPPPPAPKAAAPPPPPAPKPPGPKPPPPPKGARPPPVPLGKPAPPGAHGRGRSSGGGSADDAESQKTKLKPFFWDKTTANIDNSMVWHELKAGSFQVNEEMMESLFGYVPTEKKSNERRKESSSLESAPQFIQIIDPKKSQNLAILLKALNVTTVEVCDALKEGNELPVELVQTLLKMAPSSEEELKLRLYNGDLTLLGPAERFLKTIVEIPFAFKRLEALLFMSCVQEELTTTKEAFETLEVACTELKNSRLFLKLLEAVLKTGNRMNDGTYRGGAQAFKLDTLLKLSDVKGLDGKTTLLHFVVQEIIRSEGARAARQARESKSLSSIKIDDLTDDSGPETAEYLRDLGLGVVSRLSTDLTNVKKAAAIDGDCLTGSLSKVGQSLIKTRDFLNNELKNMEEDSEFFVTISNFVKNAETEITRLQAEEKRITALVKSTVDYFHGSSGKDEGLRLFVIVRDFLVFLDRSCDDIRKKALAEAAAAAVAAKAANKAPKRESSSASTVAENKQPSMPDIRQKLFPVIQDRRVDDSSSSSSDDES